MNKNHAHRHLQRHLHDHEHDHHDDDRETHVHGRDAQHSTTTLSEESGLQQEGLSISGMDCADCALQLERILVSRDGVTSADVSFAASKINVCFDPRLISLTEIEDQIGHLGYGVTSEHGPVSRSKFRISGMDCTECAEKVRRAVALMPGVFKADLSFAGGTLEVEHDRAHAPIGRIIQTVEQTGYTASPVGKPVSQKKFWTSMKTMLTAASGVFLIAGAALSLAGAPPLLAIAFYLTSMISGGLYIARSAYYSVKTRSLDMNFLMTAAAIGAAGIGEWAEGATVVFLFSLGNTLQSFSLDRTRQAIQQLMSLAPLEATVKRGGVEVKVPVDDVSVGDVVIVKPGERIPVDGLVVWGSSAVNEAAITGESVPADKVVGSRVFAGSHNEEGALEIRSTEQPQNTALSRIIRLVEDAQASRAPSQQLVDRFAHYYTPAVVGAAVVVAVIPTLMGGSFDVWFYRALALLIIACPCALVISTPVSLVSAIGAATRHGVLIKDGASLENLGSLSIIAFDKTGTLTSGRPQLRNVTPLNGHSEEHALTIAASIERHSPHPLARAMTYGASQRKLQLLPVEGFVSIPGRGVKGRVGDELFYVGKPKLFHDLVSGNDLPTELVESSERDGETAILLGTESELISLFTFSDQARKRAAGCVADLKSIGIDKTVILTGDNHRAADRIAADLGVDEVHSELLPEDKVSVIRALQDGGKVGAIGDGVNDAPALATADVGIAMGAIGSDITLETADVALLSDDLSKLPYAVSLSRKTLGVIKQNIAISILVKAAFLALAPFGLITLWLAVIADTGVSLLVTANGMRLFKVKEITTASKIR